MTTTVLGHEVRRVEDPALLTGEARFLADLPVEDLLHAVFVRSTSAHGVLRSVDTTDVIALPDVVAVFTAADLDLPPQGADTSDGLARPLLATDRVRFVGEPVAVVLATSYAAAVDAADRVILDVEPLPVLLDAVHGATDGAPLLFPDNGTNVVGGRHRLPARPWTPRRTTKLRRPPPSQAASYWAGMQQGSDRPGGSAPNEEPQRPRSPCVRSIGNPVSSPAEDYRLGALHGVRVGRGFQCQFYEEAGS
jgi:CO/xanthine dehydrogenase Mo-binding subunit